VSSKCLIQDRLVKYQNSLSPFAYFMSFTEMPPSNMRREDKRRQYGEATE